MMWMDVWDDGYGVMDTFVCLFGITVYACYDIMRESVFIRPWCHAR